MDHLDVDFGALEGRIVQVLDVVEEIAGEGGVGSDGGGLEAEVVVVLGDFFVDGCAPPGDGNGNDGDSSSRSFFGREEAAVDVIEGSGWEFITTGGDELHTGLIEVERSVAVVCDDDAHGDEGVADVREPEEVTVAWLGAGIDGNRDVFLRVGVECRVLRCRERGRRFLS